VNKENEIAFRVFFIGNSFSIKGSNAPSNLIRNISRGLAEAGLETWLIPFSLEYGKYLGNINGVKYYNPLAIKVRPGLLLVRRFNRVFRYFRLPFFLAKLGNREYNTLIYFGESLAMILYCKVLAFTFCSKYFLYSVEHPFGAGSTLSSIEKRYLLPLSRIVFDGYLCITHNLSQLFNARKPKPTLVIPSVVDYNLFNKHYPRPVDYEYICYAGSVTVDKDAAIIFEIACAFSKPASPFK